MRDPNLCFICQEKTPEFSITLKPESKIKAVKVCLDCKGALEYEQKRRNRVKQALAKSSLLTQVLGLKL